MLSYHAKPFAQSSQNALETRMSVDEPANTVVVENKIDVKGDANIGGTADIAGALIVGGNSTFTGSVTVGGAIQVQNVYTGLPTAVKSLNVLAANGVNAQNIDFTAGDLNFAGLCMVSGKLSNNAAGFYFLGTVQVVGGNLYSFEAIKTVGFTNLACGDGGRRFILTPNYNAQDFSVMIALHRIVFV